MNVSNILNALAKEKLDQYLLQWFKSSSISIRGRIVALHYARELALEEWEDRRYGLEFSRDFARYLAKIRGRYEPCQIIGEFCEHYASRYFAGSSSIHRNDGEHSYLVGVDNLIRGDLDFLIPDLEYIPINILEGYVISLLRQGKRKTGHNNIAWLSVCNDRIDRIRKLKEYCNLVGKPFRLLYPYALLIVDDMHKPLRPTIGDAGCRYYFYPTCDDHRWGRALRTRDLSKGLPECVIEEDQHSLRLQKIFASSSTGIGHSQSTLWRYYNREMRVFRESYKLEYEGFIRILGSV